MPTLKKPKEVLVDLWYKASTPHLPKCPKFPNWTIEHMPPHTLTFPKRITLQNLGSCKSYCPQQAGNQLHKKRQEQNQHCSNRQPTVMNGFSTLCRGRVFQQTRYSIWQVLFFVLPLINASLQAASLCSSLSFPSYHTGFPLWEVQVTGALCPRLCLGLSMSNCIQL